MQDLSPVITINDAVQQLIPYLEDTGRAAHQSIYFDGWDGLSASAVLRAIAEQPPPSLMKKFDRIIHVDCSRWKSRRALQRAIADELKLPQTVMAAFDRQDEEDDFSGLDETSRAEILDVSREIYQTIRDLSCLMIFHNGSNQTINLSDFGFLPLQWLSDNKVLWTFRGRLRLNPEIKEKVDDAHLLVYLNLWWSFDLGIAQLVLEEATEVVKCTRYKQIVDPETAAKCILYLLWLNRKGGGTINYDWKIHASNYWVCDGIIGGEGHFDERRWKVSTALHHQIRIDDCSSHNVNFEDDQYTEHWDSVTYTSDGSEGRTHITTAVSQNQTSFFLAAKDKLYTRLSPDMFKQSEKLCVLKLSGCTFNFYSPPFQCCPSLRFLGLDRCKDVEEEGKQGRSLMEFLWSLWVLDISHMDWELDLSQDTIAHMSANIREIHIKKGRIWRSNLLLWRHLKNLRKLRVIEPTRSWETVRKDDFEDMVKLDLLDLSGDSNIQVLPSLSTATGLKTLVLDGCVELDHVGPEGLPPLLETFSLDARSDKLLKLCLAGCPHLENFLLRGALPALVELNLSGTSVRRVDLSDKVVKVEGLKKVFLLGCKQLRAILWWEETRKLEVLCISTLETEETRPFQSYVVASDARIIQSLLLKYGDDQFMMVTRRIYLDLHVPPTSNKYKWPTARSGGEVIPTKPCCYSNDVDLVEGVLAAAYGYEAIKWPPALDRHMEVGEGIRLTDVESDTWIKAIAYVMAKCIDSLHLHDNSCIIAVTHKPPPVHTYPYNLLGLNRCRVERCPNLQAVFMPYPNGFRYYFDNLETIWASDLPMARSIWSKGTIDEDYSHSLAALQIIHVHNCPRLMYVLPLSRSTYLPRLETLHISQCGDLRQVFPWDVNASRQYREAGHVEKAFPELKHIHLHGLSNLQEICEAKMMSAPVLESVSIRGCWGLKRLPAVGRRRDGPRRPAVVVHCDTDWWEKLEWDGLDAGHHPSLYEPRFWSSYCKKRLLRGTVLR